METSRELNKLIYSVILAIPLLLSGGLGQAQGQTNNVNVFVVVTPTTYQLDLKAIEGENPTRNFIIKPESVVQVKQGDNLVVATQPITQVVESVKVQDQKGVIKELESLGNNVYSLAGIPFGAHILDVIVDLGSNKKGAYETILVILEQGQQPVNPTQIINQVKQITDVNVVFEDGCSNRPGSSKIGFPHEDKTECQLEEWNDCKELRERVGGTNWGPKCDKINDTFTDNDCLGFKNQKECDDWYKPKPICKDTPTPIEGKCIPTPPPYCDENTPAGQLCRDEIDDCTDESGCEPVDCKANPNHADCINDITPQPEPIEGIPDVPEEDNNNDNGNSGNEDNGSVDNGDNGNSDNESDNGESDNGDSGDTGEPFD